MLSFFPKRLPVATTPTLILRFRPARLHSLVIKAEGAFDLGDSSVQVGSGGADLAENESFSMSWEDFNMKNISDSDEVELYGVAPVATHVRIMRFMR